jgi:hypothetical protein
VAPDDVKLALIWAAWNAFPAKTDEQHRYRVLVGDLPIRAGLKKRFPYLPFDVDEYWSTFLRVLRWVELKAHSRTTNRLHRKFVTNQWAFNESDQQAVSRIAIYRAQNELAITKPGLLSNPAPRLEDIDLFENRFCAYESARLKALRVVAQLLCKIPGMCEKPTRPLELSAAGFREPPKGIPLHLYVARLDALGMCSESGLRLFLRHNLPRLDPKRRREFYEASLTANFGKESHSALKVWLCDNVPVFEAFDWRWPDIHTAAMQLGLLKTGTQQSLEKWASHNKLSWQMKKGVPPIPQADQVRLSTTLLSPRPVFGDILDGAASRSS